MNDLRILLVEDDPADAYLIQYMIQRIAPKAVITQASDGELAIEKMMQSASQKQGPDVVLLDLNLPKKNGYAVLEEARNLPEMDQTAFVILSTSNRLEDEQKSLSLRADAFLSKSIDVVQFSAEIEKLLRIDLPNILKKRLAA